MISVQNGPKSTSNSTPTPPVISSSDVDFGIISYRDDVWSIQYRGKEAKLALSDGEGTSTWIEGIMVKASGTLCSDGLKNLAVVPLNNLRNEAHGGPMLLRVPVSSLEGMARFGEKMQALGYPYYSFGARISIAKDGGHPKFLFNAIRALTDEEADVVIELQGSPLVTHILTDGSFQKSSTSTAATPPVEPRELKGGVYSAADALALLNSNFFLADQGSAFPVARITGGRIDYVGDCPSSDDLRLVRRFVKGGSGSSGLEFKRPATDAASVGWRWLHA
jgi:hypothetical protein